VTDPGGQPLSGVVVAVQGLGLSVATSATGRYVLPRVLAGQHVLQFQRMGYAPHEVTVDVATDTACTADAVLDPQPIELGTVLVEGVSRVPDRMIDAPAAVEVVRPATAEAVSITGQVPLALVRVPGLDVAQGGVTDFNVNARGFNTMFSRKMLVLQDGRDLGTAVVGAQFWGAWSEPLEDLGRIEVIRGPGSALYGANAFNGVISITTPPARDVVGTKLTLGGGELGTGPIMLQGDHGPVEYRNLTITPVRTKIPPESGGPGARPPDGSMTTPMYVGASRGRGTVVDEPTTSSRPSFRCRLGGV
jgi:outer membrane receptor protein involved in Fe transport